MPDPKDIAEAALLAVSTDNLKKIIDHYERDGKDDAALQWLRSSLAILVRRAADTDTHVILEQ